MDQIANVGDGLDETIALWSRTLPDMDLNPLGVILRISRLHLGLTDDLQKFLRPMGIGPGEMDVLFYLLNSGPPYEQRPSDLSKGCYVTTGATTGRVNRLIEAGLVERVASSADRRETLARLTPEGERMATSLKREVAAPPAVVRALNAMTTKDSTEFCRLLRDFHVHLQQSRKGNGSDGLMSFGARP
ncbi:MarR family winged helix-turn-helix transcriptional regulator [Novosphingobium sp.]|uniref:MarR family winged helix-turn-helix transcriptional regulator n=1 Tax=Novosphingobium sp. TaxID=1874826 RepID=UPI002FE4003D